MSKDITNGGNPQKDFYKPVQFSGNYTATGGNYYQHTTTSELIKVCQRKQPTANKPTLYLVSKTIDGRYPFLSSLYQQTTPNTFTAEINRVYYNVVMDTDSLTITQK